ncbi:YdcF family protein [Cytobacillus sp. NCCP-133]|uniref:YdcF family protein n=1 Tax=Cytobacillus sp. NCCP-133 TaxID=766848 RepID=UPI002232919C|nr:YdcF family protein [Cytobacillus sp. NCCP-133]
MKISELDPNHLSDKEIAALLYSNLNDDMKMGDCIFVPGSSKAAEYRLPEAVRLYRAGRAKKILFSGGVVWPGSSLSEAEVLKNKAILMGIPEKDILTEEGSRHTKENVLASMLVLDRAIGLHNISRIIIVTAPFHMRRMLLTMKTYMPTWINYSLVIANDGTTRADNWHSNPCGRKRAEDEAKKIIHYVRSGVLNDLLI